MRDCLTSMPAVELVGLVRRLPRFHAPDEWGFHEENTARLLEAISAWLSYEYASWITDPDDPEYRRAQAERRRRGIKPPPEPLIPPVALRPPDVAAERRRAWLEESAQHDTDRPDLRLISSDEFDAALGI